MKNLVFFFSILLCSITSFAQKVTYSGSVAAIIYDNCTSCHRTGSIAPFSLESYDDAYSHRYIIRNATQKKIMPPWSPNPTYKHFANERVLTKAQIDAIAQWVNDSAQRGDSTKEPAKPVFSDASMLTSPDFSKRINTHKVKKKQDEFRFFSLSSGLNVNSYIKQLEILPGNRKIVHHAFLFIDSIGTFAKKVATDTNFVINGNNYLSGGSLNQLKLIGGWLPGGSYYSTPDSFCFRVPKKSSYILQIHYAPGSYGQFDSTQLNIKYSTDSTHLTNMNMRAIMDSVNLTNGPIFIPANKTKTFIEKRELNDDIKLLSITPHMHLIGKRLKVYGYNPKTGDTIPIIDDRWNFHWQGMYTFLNPIKLRRGTILYAEGTYENDSNNTDNPNYPPEDIKQGTTTHTEMLQVFFCYLGANFDEVLTQIPGQISTSNYFSLWPNPAHSGEEVSLQLAKDKYQISLLCTDGRILRNYSCVSDDGKLNILLPSMPKGLYFLKIYGSDNIKIKKFMIE
jgi:hypothetical protein